MAVLSPLFAAAGAFTAVHEQAMRRLTEVTGLIAPDPVSAMSTLGRCGTLEITDPGESEGRGRGVGAARLGPSPAAPGRLPPFRLRAEQRDVMIEQIARYNPEAVVCVGIPFGHTRPQWIIPHGGTITVDGTARRVVAGYS
jgi:hypothetical protein